MAKHKLSSEEVTDALQNLPGWEVQHGKLHKAFKFETFAEALGWMVAVGVYADKMDHHPDWSNGYNRVTVDLVTHDMDNSISNLDVELAGRMNALAATS